MVNLSFQSAPYCRNKENRQGKAKLHGIWRCALYFTTSANECAQLLLVSWSCRSIHSVYMQTHVTVKNNTSIFLQDQTAIHVFILNFILKSMISSHWTWIFGGHSAIWSKTRLSNNWVSRMAADISEVTTFHNTRNHGNKYFKYG